MTHIKEWLWKGVLSAFFVLVVFVVAASVKLVVVAVESQPDCLEHEKQDENDSDAFVAAKSSC